MAAGAAALLAAPQAALAGDGGMSSAEKIRRLDIMLMVTGLRCRRGADDFQADYERFTQRQEGALRQANLRLQSEMGARYGAAGANRMLDRMNVTIANSYGVGHPWLDCHALRMVTRNLAQVEGEATLAEAAGQLLAPSGSAQFALAGR